MIADEERAGLASVEGYESFALQVKHTKWALVEFLLTARETGQASGGVRRAG